MGVELRRGVAFDRPGGVVLEGRGNELARSLRLPNVADPRLGVALQLGESCADALAVCFSYPVVAAD